MSIVRVPPPPKNVEEFIARAPDAAKKRVTRGRKEQLSVTMKHDLVTKIDAISRRIGLSRAATINLIMYRYFGGEGKEPNAKTDEALKTLLHLYM